MKLTTHRLPIEYGKCLDLVRMAMESRNASLFDGIVIEPVDEKGRRHYLSYGREKDDSDCFCQHIMELSLAMYASHLEMMDFDDGSWRVAIVTRECDTEATNIGGDLVDYICKWIS